MKNKLKNNANDPEPNDGDLTKTPETIYANRQIMAQIIQGSTIPTFVIDNNHVITHWNKALESLTGYPEEQMVGTKNQWVPFWDNERPSMADVILDQISEKEIKSLYGTKWNKSVLLEEAYEAEIFFPKLGDNGKWCFFTAAPIRSPEGKIIGAIETLWDKTKEKEAEAEQARHTKELATLCSIYATLSAPLDLNGRIIEALKETTNIFSFDSVCVFTLGKDGRFYLKYSYGQYEDLCEKKFISDNNSMVFKIAQSNKFEVFEDINHITNDEFVVLRKEGLQSLVYAPLVDKEKKAFGVIRAGSKQIKQFTEEDKRVLELIGNRMGVAIENSILQEEVRRKANFQSKLINSSNNAIVATDENWDVVLFNPEAERLFGYKFSEQRFEKLNAKKLLPSEVIQFIKAGVQGKKPRHKIVRKETIIEAKNGEKIPVSYSGTPLFEHGRMMGCVTFFQDLREVKRLENELISSERLAAIGQTVAGMAHSIKNILSGFKGGQYLVDIGIDKKNTDKLINGWQMIKRNIDQTSDLVMDLLTYSKEREPDYQDCFPNDIADDVCELVKEKASLHGIRIVKDFSESIGEISMDPKTVHQCLLNLVTNAVDGCIMDDSVDKKHQVHVALKSEDDTLIRFEVTDNGSGMSEEVKSKLFTAFFSTKGSKGTGLGLLVTHKLIEEHLGSIDVVSELNVGTTFVMKLPCKAKGGR